MRRGLPDLDPLLEMLCRATRALRAADWARDGNHGAHGDGEAAGGEGGAARRHDRPPGRFRGRAVIAPPGSAIAEAGPALRRGTTTAMALVEQCLAAIAAHDSALNAYVTVLRDDARRQARTLDAELARGVDRGPLHGIPISLKDIIDLAGTPTTAASRLRAGHRAATDAPLVARLRAAGAVFIGKCNLHEFAFGTSGEESAYGPTRNPHAPAHMPGGSSSGSAVSVAAGMALASIGTDTGGSIRIPASACGVVGLKPSHGEVSTAGVVPLAPSLDHAGPIARSVEDAATLYRIMRAGRTDGAAAGPRGEPPVDSRPRLGIPRRYFLDLVEPAVRDAFDAAVQRLARAGCRIDDADLPHAADTAPVYLHTQLAEAAECHRADLDGRPEEYGRGVRLRLELGRYVLAEDYVRAQRGRRILTAEVDAALEPRAALLLPTLPVVPPRLGAESITVGDTTETARALTLRLTQLFDVTGHPAISIPCGTAGGLPAGAQLVGRRGGTERFARPGRGVRGRRPRLGACAAERSEAKSCDARSWGGGDGPKRRAREAFRGASPSPSPATPRSCRRESLRSPPAGRPPPSPRAAPRRWPGHELHRSRRGRC